MRTERVGSVDDLLRRRTLAVLSGLDGAEARTAASGIIAEVMREVRDGA